jgi:hypothetical protein
MYEDSALALDAQQVGRSGTERSAVPFDVL